ncbi:MAG TPA: hypothetical protein VGB26_05360 [Nitrospiria bacterium]|jgi:DNA-directed RNA polymerase subunit RPC12/RpoP
MTTRLVVSTRCPTCDGPIDFTLGSNAIQCHFCRSNLLVTGRKQTLSYYIAPTLNAHRAVAKTNLAHKARGHSCQIIQPHLYFIPYYRLTGHDLRWEEEVKETEIKSFEFNRHLLMASEWDSPFMNRNGDLFSVFQLAGNLLGQHFKTKGNTNILEKPTTSSTSSYTHHNTRPTSTSFFDTRVNAKFQDRYVEKNFIACHLEEGGIYSLGVRPSVLRLELFQKERIQSLGKIVGVDISPQEAFSHGMKTVKNRVLLYRRVLGQVLSIIYFPYWIIEVKKGEKKTLTLIDAVSEKVTELDATTHLLKELDHKSPKTSQIIGFRPLACPNCGWDLPVRPDDVIFFCSSCQKPWQIFGNQLYEVDYKIAKVPNTNGHARHLPFWILHAQIKGGQTSRLFLPAFRFIKLKALKNLARVFSNKQPDYGFLQGKIPELHECFYDQEDALKLAQITYVGMAQNFQEAIQAIEENQFKVSGLTLTWFPFKSNGLSLIDPFSGFAIPRNLLR